MLDNTACPKFRKLCSHCGKFYPDDMAVCVQDMHMLVTIDWDNSTTELDSWLEKSKSFGSKHCLRCHKHYRKIQESFCPEDGNVLERCIHDEPEGPILKDRFQLKSFIGNGNLSRVYYAIELDTGAPRVVKFLRADLASDEKTVSRYMKVAKAAIELQQPNIVRTYAAGKTESSTPYVVTQYIAGQSLKDELQKRNRLDPVSTLNIFIDLTRGLQYAHASNVVHSNLIPSNVYIIQKGERASAMIVDFGAAQRLFRTTDWSDGDSAGESETSNVYGDPQGICPEFCTGSRPSFQSDIYQVGCCLYESLNGRPPFLRNRPLATIMAHAKDEPDEFDAGVNEMLRTITLECLKKNPEERFQTATELRYVLEECRKELTRSPYIERSIS
jgi:serine/threonine-protein kinase